MQQAHLDELVVEGWGVAFRGRVGRSVSTVRRWTVFAERLSLRVPGYPGWANAMGYYCISLRQDAN